MGDIDNPGSQQVTRRGFLGWGATLLTAVVVPGAAVMLGETAAAAATFAPLAPYALTSWNSLTNRTVQAAARGGGAGTALKVVKVTNLVKPTTKPMSGDVFSVAFQVTKALPPGIYTVTAPGLGSFPLYISGRGTSASAMINRRMPA